LHTLGDDFNAVLQGFTDELKAFAKKKKHPEEILEKELFPLTA